MLYSFEEDHWVVFAKFFITDEREMLICLDKDGLLMIFDAMKLKHEALKHSPLVSVNLFENCKIFEDIKSEHTLLEDPVEMKHQ